MRLDFTAAPKAGAEVEAKKSATSAGVSRGPLRPVRSATLTTAEMTAAGCRSSESSRNSSRVWVKSGDGSCSVGKSLVLSVTITSARPIKAAANVTIVGVGQLDAALDQLPALDQRVGERLSHLLYEASEVRIRLVRSSTPTGTQPAEGACQFVEDR